eukprot:7378447-Pyramimonas_sp.AAC.1
MTSSWQRCTVRHTSMLAISESMRALCGKPLHVRKSPIRIIAELQHMQLSTRAYCREKKV